MLFSRGPGPTRRTVLSATRHPQFLSSSTEPHHCQSPFQRAIDDACSRTLGLPRPLAHCRLPASAALSLTWQWRRLHDARRSLTHTLIPGQFQAFVLSPLAQLLTSSQSFYSFVPMRFPHTDDPRCSDLYFQCLSCAFGHSSARLRSDIRSPPVSLISSCCRFHLIDCTSHCATSPVLLCFVECRLPLSPHLPVPPFLPPHSSLSPTSHAPILFRSFSTHAFPLRPRAPSHFLLCPRHLFPDLSFSRSLFRIDLGPVLPPTAARPDEWPLPHRHHI